MTRKDYETIAACFRVQSEIHDTDDRTVRLIASAIALELKLDNPRFDQDVFLTACGAT